MVTLTRGNLSLTISDAKTGRRCGDCQLCCKLLPVRAIDKPGFQRCRHQRVGKGCVVYHKPGMPPECALWSCRWLVDSATAGLRRPDSVHYVIDIMPDLVIAGGEERSVIQIWLDPAYPDAHRDPALRGYLAREAETHGTPALVRCGNDAASFLLVPPAIAPDGVWHELRGQQVQTKTGMLLIDRLEGA